MKRIIAFLLFMLAIATSGALAQTPPRLTADELQAVTRRCAPGVPFETIHAITLTESSLYPYAISVNYPAMSAARIGYPGHQLAFARQPRSRTEAIAWMHWFQQHHLTVSVGLMQINVENARRVGFTPEELFEPCANVAVGAWILKTNFSKALKLYGSQQDALYAAFSAYNTGSLTGGTGEEYASRILANARRAQFTSKPPKVKRTAP